MDKGRKYLKWKKILYKDQGVPDDFVDSFFLQELRKNVHVRHFTYGEAITGALSVSGEISCVCILFAMHYFMERHMISTTCLFIGLAAVTIICYLLFVNSRCTTVSDNMKSVVIFLSFGYGMSPILKTLTDTISSDTIHTMSIIMMLIHLVFYDYGADSTVVSTSISLNAAIFGAVCLASRLRLVFDVFVFLTLAVEIFVLYPIFRKVLMNIYPKKSKIVLTIIVCASTILTVSSISLYWAGALSLSILSVNICCPIWYIKFQHHKDNIHGPWDEAIIKQKKTR